jgi:hypothetical protein
LSARIENPITLIYSQKYNNNGRNVSRAHTIGRNDSPKRAIGRRASLCHVAAVAPRRRECGRGQRSIAMGYRAFFNSYYVSAGLRMSGGCPYACPASSLRTSKEKTIYSLSIN